MTAANHNFYLREFYGANRLAKGEMTHRRHAPRHAQGEDPGLRAGHEGGPHRAGAARSSPARSCSAARSSSCCRARATSPASSTRPTRSSTSTGPTRKRAKTLEQWIGDGQGASRLVVAALGGVARRAFGRLDGAARARREARRHRGRARLLRQDEVLDAVAGIGQPPKAIATALLTSAALVGGAVSLALASA